jgi:hypothetical protein
MSNLPTHQLAAQLLPFGTPVRVNGFGAKVVGHAADSACTADNNPASDKFDLLVVWRDNSEVGCVCVTIVEALQASLDDVTALDWTDDPDILERITTRLTAAMAAFSR